MTGLVPFYIRTVYKREPVFTHSKIIYSLGANTFSESLGDNFVKAALISNTIKEKDLAIFAEGTCMAMQRGGASFADAITIGDADVDPVLLKEFGKVKGKKTLPLIPSGGDLTEYLNLYNELAD
jgi:starch synthase